jgi:hypothetical protein
MERGELSTFALARALVERLGLLARKEVELARVEARADARRGLVAGGLGAMAALALSAAVACGMIAAVEALGRVMPRWLAALAGALLFLAVGALFATLAAAEGRRARPDRTLRSARDTVRALQHPHEVTP